MSVHTNAFLINYKDETAFASGGGSTANTPQELVAADLTAIDKCISWKPGLPKPEREELFHLASGLTPDTIEYTIPPGSGSGKFYFQTDDLYDWAVSATLGTMGTSKAWRYKSPYANAERDLYGTLCTHWDLDITHGKPIYQNVEWITAQAKIASTTPIVGGILAFSTAAIKTYRDVALTIDSIALASNAINSIKFNVDNTFDDSESAYILNSAYIQQPALLERDLSFEISFSKNASDTWDADTMNTAVQTIAATLNFSLFTLTLANYNVWETNMDELDERGVIKRTAKFKRGVGATQAKS